MRQIVALLLGRPVVPEKQGSCYRKRSSFRCTIAMWRICLVRNDKVAISFTKWETSTLGTQRIGNTRAKFSTRMRVMRCTTSLQGFCLVEEIQSHGRVRNHSQRTMVPFRLPGQVYLHTATCKHRAPRKDSTMCTIRLWSFYLVTYDQPR